MAAQTAGGAGHARQRYLALDGIRGVAIALVVMSHAWTLFPLGPLRNVAPLDGLFHGGNLAVSIFFVIGGFLVTRTLMARRASPDGLRPARYLVQRYVRIGVQVYLLVITILVVHAVDPADPFSTSATVRSAAAVVTHTWNWYLMNNALNARADLGHLWYLSVQEQFYVGLVVVIGLFARNRRRLVIGLAVMIVLVVLWRAHVFVTEQFRGSVRTTTRMDGLLWGMLAALVFDRFERLRPHARRVLAMALLAILALVLTSAHYGDHAYYTLQGIAINVAVVLFIVAAMHLSDDAPGVAGRPAGAATRVEVWSQRIVTWTPLARLGEASLVIYVWHYPLFWFVSVHTHGWSWFTRTLLALAVLGILTVALERWVERPVQRRLRGRGRGSDTGATGDLSVAGTAEPVEPLEHSGGPLVR